MQISVLFMSVVGVRVMGAATHQDIDDSCPMAMRADKVYAK